MIDLAASAARDLQVRGVRFKFAAGRSRDSAGSAVHGGWRGRSANGSGPRARADIDGPFRRSSGQKRPLMDRPTNGATEWRGCFVVSCRCHNAPSVSVTESFRADTRQRPGKEPRERISTGAESSRPGTDPSRQRMIVVSTAATYAEHLARSADRLAVVLSCGAPAATVAEHAAAVARNAEHLRAALAAERSVTNATPRHADLACQH